MKNKKIKIREGHQEHEEMLIYFYKNFIEPEINIPILHKWMKFLSILLMFISCRDINNRILNQKVVTFFSWQPSRFLFSLDSIGIVNSSLKPDSIYFTTRSNGRYLSFPKDSIKILSDDAIAGRTKIVTENNNRNEYMIMEIPDYNIDELLNKSKDSLAILMKSYIKDNFKLVIYKNGILFEKNIDDTSKIILKPVYWGVD